jgi:Skp family chaperone for outer membrane proteins
MKNLTINTIFFIILTSLVSACAGTTIQKPVTKMGVTKITIIKPEVVKTTSPEIKELKALTAEKEAKMADLCKEQLELDLKKAKTEITAKKDATNIKNKALTLIEKEKQTEAEEQEKKEQALADFYLQQMEIELENYNEIKKIKEKKTEEKLDEKKGRDKTQKIKQEEEKKKSLIRKGEIETRRRKIKNRKQLQQTTPIYKLKPLAQRKLKPVVIESGLFTLE